jgi:hypothetical protein
MKIFISWSGTRSRAIASALKQWLPDVFQGLDVWMSDHDIEAGERWGVELGTALRECKLGIICLTAESLQSRWLTFEAGALSTAIDGARVIPYRFQLRSADISPPLSQFQDVGADDERAFTHWWPDLKAQLGHIEHIEPSEVRTDREVLEEILELARQTGIRDLNNVLSRLLSSTNVRHVEVAPKQVAGVITSRLALRITVAKKLPLAEIPPDQLIPATIFGMPTDVIEAA